MKKIYLLLAMACGSLAIHAQTLISYGNNSVSKDEFLRAYNKNKTAVTDREKAIREYIELYSNFKLKVKAAEQRRFDTLPQLLTDIENFRKQVEENYMSDEKGMNDLMNQAFERSQVDLHVLHFSVPIDPTANPIDTMKMYDAIQAAYNSLQAGGTSVQNSLVKSGDLGFVTVFTLPYEYENIVYSLKPGQTSKPYRSASSWHIFKVTEQRKSAGKWKIAQILFSFQPDADAAEKASLQRLADSVYNLIKAGANFSDMARSFSNDKLTFMTGGEMAEFGTGKFDYAFEKEVFSLAKDGDVSRPFTTSFGIHIVKRLGFTPMPTDKNDNSLQFDLRQKTMQDSRISSAKEKFAKDIISKIGFKKETAVKEADLLRYADSAMINPDPEYVQKLPIYNKTIIRFAKGDAKGSDWLKFVKEYKENYSQYKGEPNVELWSKYQTIASLEYYKKHLEEYNEDFRFQMLEFKEGNMLFEIMEKNVWSKASGDSIGLLKYYNANKENYKWAASADVLIFNAVNEKAAQDAMTGLQDGKSWRAILENANGELQADSGRYELEQLTGNSQAAPQKNSFSAITKNADGTAMFIKYMNIYEPNQQRNFEDARGLVINDYQIVLEKEWLQELRKKYPVKVNEAVLKTILK